MYLDNRKNLIKFQGHTLKVKDTKPDFLILYQCEVRCCC